MIQPITSIRLPRALKALLGPAFQDAVPYEVRIEGVGEDTYLRVYKPAVAGETVGLKEQLQASLAEEDAPPPKPNTAAGEDCNARLSPDGTHYIHKHDCQRAIELDLPREPAPAPAAEKKLKGGPLAQRAGILGSEGAFAVFLGASGKDHAASILRERCGIQSRAELDHNPEAARKFLAIVADYDIWMQAI